MISAEVKGWIGGDIWKGVCRYSVTSAAAMEECGWNTSVKCLANRLAFSIGLRAHPPCGRRIGGIIYGGAREFPGGFP